jgi:uncharacterized protein (DUF1330 family)
MPAYAVAHLRHVTMGPDIVEYLRRIDATLSPFGGRFVVHGGAVDILEGQWSGDLVMIGFKDRETAHAWYQSDAYRDILRLRTDNAEGDTFIIGGVPDGHRATDVLTAGDSDRSVGTP